MIHESLSFSLLWAIPFGGILLSLALIPLFSAQFWHYHYVKILLGWTLAFLACLGVAKGTLISVHMLVDALLHHYVPFMALVTLLFTVGGGIHIQIKGKASPFANAGLLGIGALLSNIVGTTGASMLLIRPLIALNRYRRSATHVIIFFIFLVSNIGGLLTPLGDPPLFIGFLSGVDFFWTTTHLIYPYLMVGGAVLSVFLMIDFYHFHKDPLIVDSAFENSQTKIQIKGIPNLIFLSIAITTILWEGMSVAKTSIMLGGISLHLTAFIRDMVLFLMAYASWKSTPKRIYEMNHFTWEPLEEVALVFLGVFITVIPVLSMLKAGELGPLNSLVSFANPGGIPQSHFYFWLTGILSSFLDNAPTYLIFFNMAGGDASFLMNQGANVLAAISTGSVFMGAMTYIGNAPNFMVRSLAVRSHIKMPGFLGYCLWSIVILLPIFWIFSKIWFSA